LVGIVRFYTGFGWASQEREWLATHRDELIASISPTETTKSSSQKASHPSSPTAGVMLRVKIKMKAGIPERLIGRGKLPEARDKA
jgi:hypothetical protein